MKIENKMAVLFVLIITSSCKLYAKTLLQRFLGLWCGILLLCGHGITTPSRFTETTADFGQLRTWQHTERQWGSEINRWWIQVCRDHVHDAVEEFEGRFGEDLADACDDFATALTLGHQGYTLEVSMMPLWRLVHHYARHQQKVAENNHTIQGENPIYLTKLLLKCLLGNFDRKGISVKARVLLEGFGFLYIDEQHENLSFNTSLLGTLSSSLQRSLAGASIDPSELEEAFVRVILQNRNATKKTRNLFAQWQKNMQENAELYAD